MYHLDAEISPFPLSFYTYFIVPNYNIHADSLNISNTCMFHLQTQLEIFSPGMNVLNLIIW